MKFFLTLFTTVLLTACGATAPVKTVIKTEHVPVTVSNDAFKVPTVPAPVDYQELVPLTPRERLAKVFEHSNSLYSHIHVLEIQINSIKQTMDAKAKEILGNQEK